MRSTCLGEMRKPASSSSSAEASAKLTQAAAVQTMRVVAGESEVPASPKHWSRGKKPALQAGQW